jgi:hypothetical protein
MGAFSVLALLVVSAAGLAHALDADSARTALEGRLGALRACLGAGTEATHGGLVLTLSVEADGTVSQLDVSTRGPGVPPEVARCAASALRATTFETSERGAVFDVRIVFAAAGTSGERVRIRDVMFPVALGRMGTVGS